jgi:Domain of unknown function (DUF397)
MEDQIELSWRKASRSGNGGGSCVEVGTGLPGKVAIRDTKRREDGMHVVTCAAFAALLADAKSGRFDMD